MTLPEFIRTHNLSHSLLFGFYGGGNYGDELLFETLANHIIATQAQDVAVAYQHPETYSRFHHDFGYRIINMHDKRALLGAFFRQKQIVVGGGGLWGLDVNANIFVLSCMLFICRRLLGKKVYLLNVGYYNSAPRLGRISAWFAGKAANVILARDTETYENFKRVNRHTEQDSDMAWYIEQLDLSAYEKEADELGRNLSVPQTGRALFITLRRFRPSYGSSFNAVVEHYLAQPNRPPVILALMEPASVDPDNYALIQQWQKRYANVQVIDFSYNPLALFLFFRTHAKHLAYIGPQFHGIITAHLNGVPFFPVSYDNKVTQLLQQIQGQQIVTIKEMAPDHIRNFAKNLI